MKRHTTLQYFALATPTSLIAEYLTHFQSSTGLMGNYVLMTFFHPSVTAVKSVSMMVVRVHYRVDIVQPFL